MTATPVLAQTPKLFLAQVLPADASGKKSLVPDSGAAVKVVSVTATSDDTAARVVQLVLTRSAVDYVIASYNVAILSGTDGIVKGTNILALAPGLPVDGCGQPYLFLEDNDVLNIKTTTTVTAAKTISVAAVGAIF